MDTEYITVVSVDSNIDLIKKQGEIKGTIQDDSQFVTVVSVGDETAPTPLVDQTETVVVYRLPGERLGFGLKFQGGSRSNENIERLFIQSCAINSPSSRATTSWGYLKEGDEILEIDGISVQYLTRLECVKSLKESNVAIKFVIRNGDAVMDAYQRDSSPNLTKKLLPPPPPPVPPRKLNRRKLESLQKIQKIPEHEISYPPSPESYTNLFLEENDFNFGETDDTDDTGSTISTVIDKYSISSSNFSNDTDLITNSDQLDKILNTFTLLEKEFSHDSTAKKYDDPQIKEVNIKMNENFKDAASDFNQTDIKSIENNSYDKKSVEISLRNEIEQTNTSNMQVPPIPRPRQVIKVEPKASIPLTPEKIQITGNNQSQFTTIHNWLQDTSDVVHECNVLIDENGNEFENDPALDIKKNSEIINDKTVNLSKENEVEDAKNINTIQIKSNADDENENSEVIVKQCMKRIDDTEMIDSNSSSDDDEEKIYEPGLMTTMDVLDAICDKGENLGPPEFLQGPCPSEAYFNFQWGSSMLPTIGEAEEEFSSLEPVGPILIINTADEFNENNNSTKNSSTKNSLDNDILSECDNNDKISINLINNLENNNNNNNNNDNKNSNNISNMDFTSSNDIVEKSLEILNNSNEIVSNKSDKSNDEIIISDIDKKCKDDVIVDNKQNHIINELKEFDYKFSVNNVNFKELIKNICDFITNEREFIKSDYDIQQQQQQQNLNINKKNILNKNINENNNLLNNSKIERIVLGIENMDEKNILKDDNVNGTMITEQKIHCTNNNNNNNNNNNEESYESAIHSTTSTTTKLTENLNKMEQKFSLEENKIIMPPTFSRLPPDGDEFPPNFTEPFKQLIKNSNNINNNNIIDINENSINIGPPPLPKSVPPKTAPRKIYRQNFVIEVDDIRNNKNETIIQLDNIHNLTSSTITTTTTTAASIPIIIEDKTIRKSTPIILQTDQRKRSIDSCIDLTFKKFDQTTISTNTLPHKFKTLTSNWRKDEKSEKSVRDKIAMFSNDKNNLLIENENDIKNAKKFIAKSTENLTSINYSLIDKTNNDYNSIKHQTSKQKNHNEINGNLISLKHKALSVENLNDIKNKNSVIIPKLRTNLIKNNSEMINRDLNNLNLYNNNNNNNKTNINNNSNNNNINNNNNNNSHKMLSEENLNNFNNMKQNENDFIKIEVKTQRISDNVNNKKREIIEIPQKKFYDTLPRKVVQQPIVARTTSFSGYTTGSSKTTATPIKSSISQTLTQIDDQRKAKINNLLEQRKKSMSKLRGLVIPEKSSISEEKHEPLLLDLPEIKNKDMQKILSNNYKQDNNNSNGNYGKENINYSTFSSSLQKNNNIRKDPLINPPKINGTYNSIFSSSRSSVNPANIKTKTSTSSTFVEDKNRINNGFEIKNISKLMKDKKIVQPPLPPVKPPRTSLILTPKSSVELKLVPTDESEDSDGVYNSQITSPPLSPVATIPEKYPLTRTLSSETNTSIASSTTSTLTSGSGSQASCSSMGSTPTVDMSRKFQKSSNTENNNRRTILASSRCRSGRDENSSLLSRQRKSDDDSTDGCEETDFNKTPKPKKRILQNKIAEVQETNRPIHYQLARKEDLVDKIINVATYVEVVSDADSNGNKTMDRSIENIKEQPQHNEQSELSKWVKSEMQKAISTSATKIETKLKDEKAVTKNSVHEKITKINSVQENPTPVRQAKTTDLITTNNYISKISANQKKVSTAEIRKAFEIKTPPTTPIIPTKPKENGHHHERLSSWDSVTSSSDLLNLPTVTKSKTSVKEKAVTKNDFGSFLSVGDEHSLISSQDLQLIIEEAEPQLETPDVFVVVLKREFPESSIGITLAGGSDYEAKEITIHRILKNSPADKDGRLKRSDRILSINGLSMKGLTHGESVSVLKTPRPEVLMVMTRSKSVVSKPLTRTKRTSLGSLSSLIDKESDNERSYKPRHASSKSLDLDAMTDNDGSITSRKGSSSSSESRYSKGLQKPESVSSVEIMCVPIEVEKVDVQEKLVTKKQINEIKKATKEVEVNKDGCGLGFSIEGGFDSPNGNMPLLVKKVFMGGAASKTGKIKAGDEIIAINNKSTLVLTRVEVWNLMKEIPQGIVLITLR